MAANINKVYSISSIYFKIVYICRQPVILCTDPIQNSHVAEWLGTGFINL